MTDEQTGFSQQPPPCQIHVDEEGEWYHEGKHIFRRDILELFYDNLHLQEDGTYVIHWRGKTCSLDVADTPFVIARVDRRSSGDGGKESIVLTFKHLDETELLDPSTLWVGRENVLYCRVRNGAFPARFLRPAYYQIARWIEQDSQTGEFFLELQGERHIIRYT